MFQSQAARARTNKKAPSAFAEGGLSFRTRSYGSMGSSVSSIGSVIRVGPGRTDIDVASDDLGSIREHRPEVEDAPPGAIIDVEPL